ncbi:MAG TPA: hypothetical protein VFE65_21185 [Pseudonocardia sp.]|jgi:hypothetical protein|nr:hypothetical protein [Pseudonocardia sp.]
MPSLRREKGIAWILVGLAVLFLAFGVVRMVTVERGANAITLPVALLASDLLIAATLVSRWQLVRPIAQGLAIFGTLVHLLVLMRNGPLWTRACAGLLVVAHVEALLLLFRMTIRERNEIDRADSVTVHGVSTEGAGGLSDERVVLAPAVAAVPADSPESDSPESDSPGAHEPPVAGEGAVAESGEGGAPVAGEGAVAESGESAAAETGGGAPSETMGSERETGSAVMVPAQRVATAPAAEAPVADQEEPVVPVRSETESEEPEGAGTQASEEGGQTSENEERAS